jgi:hypothetical protein
MFKFTGNQQLTIKTTFTLLDYIHKRSVRIITLNNLIIFIIFFLFTSSSYSNNLQKETTQSSKSFKLYDSIGDKNKPDLKKYGFTFVRSIPANQLWPPDNTDKSKPDLVWIKKFAELLPSNLSILNLDIEHWQLNNQPKTDTNRNIDYLISIADTIRKKRPDLNIGYYSLLPIIDYNNVVSSNQGKLSQWRTENKYLSKLSNHVDTIYPSLYTFNTNRTDWKKYAVKNIKEAREYGKPVIAFLWPQYHGSNLLLRHDHIDKEYWRTQLETVYEYADGVIIWTPWGKEQSEWDSNSGWWKATLEFIEKHQLNK